jgi:chorismate synthase
MGIVEKNVKSLFFVQAELNYLTPTTGGLRDYRGGGRSSAREIACRVAAGAHHRST